MSLLGLAVLSAHAAVRWLDPSPHVPGPQDRAQAQRLLDYLVRQGPRVFVPAHPFYNVLAGGTGHLHVIGLDDVYYWPRSITSDPERDKAIRDRFRTSVRDSFRSERWTVVIQDDCHTARLFGLSRYYHRADDLARRGMSPPVLTGYPCAPSEVWAPRAEDDAP